MPSEESGNPLLRSIDAIREFRVVDPLESAGSYRCLAKIESPEAGTGEAIRPKPDGLRGEGKKILGGLFFEGRSMSTAGR